MKKKKLKLLKLNKKSICNFEQKVNGGKAYPTFQDNSVCNFCETELICSSWWGGQLCKPCD
ncbi:hypothetical protein KORDIASMS9_00398 [Kordia sp. SMS9]|uniref:hypothetical protein n=1 Tax=Kordia sp. SMS9 TaxID=2282170 RepID=UPI000E0DFB7D|nr:hypothetical protein [Kordia sp. SMS9]AXG68206.1 hypothetical protein KORDIASMS9_00398 [Kordia sp. SMS9]